MSKLKLNTREKILDKALEMFNERGIEYVGLRELAGVLGIRVGNITYYFPTKDDLVYALSQELSRTNSAIIVSDGDMSMKIFLNMQFNVFKNHQKFRCLLLSFVHIMQQNKLIADAYKNTQKTRRDTIKKNIHSLVDGGYLKLEDESQYEFLVSAVSLVSRFWISEAAISFFDLSTVEQITHYMKLIINIFLPYTTSKGRKETKIFLAENN
jgi:AcrR family transcriptional regulator